MNPRRRIFSPAARCARRRAGFTLLEILLSLALVALMLVALNTFVFSMGELWGKNTDIRLFEQHVRAVTRALDRELRAATLPPAARANASPVAPQEIRPSGGTTDTLLTFELPAGTRLISWPGPALPEVVCSLQARQNEGLILLWHSRLEPRFEADPPRETILTPFVTAIAYDYYDTALLRLEQLYPFPHKVFAAELKKYPNATEVVWCQDEPQNQGAWFFVQHYLFENMATGQKLGYSGRAASASPAVGYSHLHQDQQKALVDGAFGRLKGFILTK